MADEESRPCSFTASTNWIVSAGSLDDTISFDSSLSPVAGDGQSEPLQPPLLVLTPPNSTDSSLPCDITVKFQSPCEVHQVYVKSNAKIYEIYYASDKHSADEYLCTVRCGIAADYGLVSGEKTCKSETEETKSVEDGWVEVKNSASDSSADRKMRSSNETVDRISQDHYEATAEITDVGSSVSLTLRLLSLGMKDFLQIKEIYIFANPVESSSSLPEVQFGNTNSSPLMSMLLPSLLQSSRLSSMFVQNRKYLNTVGIEKQEERSEPLFTESGEEQEIEHGAADGGKGMSQESVTEKAETRNLEAISKSAVSEEKRFNLINIERALHQLDYRVSRIEACIMRFEETILKPIKGIEEKFQRLEQKLDSLKLNSLSTKIAAPDFLWDKCRDSSFCKDEIINQANTASESSNISHFKNAEPPMSYSNDGLSKQFQSCKFPVGEFIDENCKSLFKSNEPSCVADITGNPTKASMVITAPDFLCDDEDFCGDEILDSLKEAPEMKPVLSIDDALTLALEGFLASTSGSLLKVGPALALKAPEFDEAEVFIDNNQTIFPPIALLSEQLDYLGSSHEDGACMHPDCVHDKLTEETVRNLRGPLNRFETAGLGVSGSCYRTLDDGKGPTENLRHDSSAGTIVSAYDTVAESLETNSGAVQGTDDANTGESDVVRADANTGQNELSMRKDQEEAGILVSDHSNSVAREPDMRGSLLDNEFEQFISGSDMIGTVNDDKCLLELEKISLNLYTDILDVDFVSHEGITDGSIEELLGLYTSETASDDIQKVESIKDGELNDNESKDEVFVYVGSVSLESVTPISTVDMLESEYGLQK